jgi:hypothetical protein
MATSIKRVPIRIVQAIEEEKLSTDHVIYYNTKDGWIYQRRDERFVSSIQNSNEQNTDTSSLDNVRPLERLGPFGRF